MPQAGGDALLEELARDCSAASPRVRAMLRALQRGALCRFLRQCHPTLLPSSPKPSFPNPSAPVVTGYCENQRVRESKISMPQRQHAQTACRPQATCSEQWLRSSAPRCSSVRGWLRSRGTDSATLLPNRAAAGELSLRQPAPDRGEIDFLSLAAGATRGTQPCHRARLSKSLWLS